MKIYRYLMMSAGLLLALSGCTDDEQTNVDGLIAGYNATARTTQQADCNCYSRDLGYDSIEVCVTDNFSPIVLSSCEQQAVKCNNQSYGSLLNCRQTAMAQFQACVEGCPADPSSCRQDYQNAMAACEAERTPQLEADFAACRNGEQPACQGAITPDATTQDAQPTPDATQPDAARDVGVDVEPDVSPDVGPEPDVDTNQRPSANAGVDQTTVVGQSVELNGGGSDPDGDALTYQWAIASQPSGSSPILGGAQQATASLQADVAGTYIVELTVSDGSLSATDRVRVTVEEPEIPCVIISEYVEGSSWNKAIELYNCGSSAVDLARINLCPASNTFDATAEACTVQITPSGSLAPGSVHVMCHPDFELPGLCDETVSVLRFNGNDRLGVYLDDDDSGAYEHGADTLLDAFGELAAPPAAADAWAETTLRRCNFTPYDGVSTFTATEYYTAHPADSFGDLGQAPTETCAP